MGKDRKKKKKKLTNSVKGPQTNLQNKKEDEEFCSENGIATSSNGHTNDTLHTKITTDNKNTKYSVEDLLQKIEEYMDTYNYDLAKTFCERALEIDSNHLELLDTAGAVFLETGELEKAKQCFQHAIELSPESGHAKYMYLGQVLIGQEAVQSFTKGIEIMTKSLYDKGAASSNAITPTDISTAYCSLAEIYMTDECFDSEAESKCYQCCEKAIESDPNNPDAYQAMANCLLSQEKIEEAQTALKKGLGLWLRSDEEDQVPMPSYESRLTSSKLLLELGDLEDSGSVLQTLLEENDEDFQVWYLLGWMYHLSGQDNASKKICLEKAHKFITQLDAKDEEVLKHIEELLSTTTCDDDAMDNDDDDVVMET